MEIFQVTNQETQKSLIVSTPYTSDHEWLYLFKSENSPLYEDIQFYGIENFKLELIETIPYNKGITLAENKKILKSREKEIILKFCQHYGSSKLYNRVSGPAGNAKSVVHNYQYFYKGVEYKTGYEVYEALRDDGYDLSAATVLAFVHRNGYLSKENQLKYPELPNLLKIIKN